MVAIKNENGQKKRCTGLQTTLLVSESDWSLFDRVIISGYLYPLASQMKKLTLLSESYQSFTLKQPIFDGKGTTFV